MTSKTCEPTSLTAARLLKTKREALLKKRVMDDLRTLAQAGNPIWYYKAQEVGRRGIPDIIACVNGLFVALELKAEGEVPTPLQAMMLANMVKAGSKKAVVVMPSTWPAILDEVKELLK
ncbi:MAG: hypothetical protein IPL34_20355 [Thiofilum sp.]|uniref:hypothetical protein n=1 Tax=Thiofilum sp. TaxID=2212733 RepID=UPI0026014492|nr:hypothetical protein [Thiofilum sp.]MBK8455635.1 hypothetical protein [Thiofilum sp.]